MISIVLELSAFHPWHLPWGFTSQSPPPRRCSWAGWCAGWWIAGYATTCASIKLTEEQLTAEGDKSPGVLLASGYIAGGAIAGIIIAFMMGVFTKADAATTKWAEAHNPFYDGPNADWLALIPFVA